ncbi:MAG: hypothetical protein M3Y31_00115 [Gemmatimonadota bacterium]|nr:hypothetical protein [Gemmatimonadota bacterium]
MSTAACGSSRSGGRAAARVIVLSLAVGLLPGTAVPAAAQDRPALAAVDLYGTFSVPDSVVRRAAAIEAGNPVPGDSVIAAAIERVRRLPGVAQVHASGVQGEDGTVLYIGVLDSGVAAPRFREAPSRFARLPDEIVAAGAAFDTAFMAAIQAGEFAEDDSLGHQLMRYPAARRVQEGFVELADRYGAELRTVLREAADPEQRRLAAQVLAYATDKRSVVAPLVAAISDPDGEVRNNAMRGLALIAALAQRRPELGIDVPHEPFISMLRSPTWTDRNKAAFALVRLTESRDSTLLATLEREVLPDLLQMARWHSPGHALPAVLILGRIAGMDDGETFEALQKGEREAVLRAAEGG